VGVALEHFGGEVVQGAAEGLPFALRVNGPPEIPDFNRLPRQQNVLRFDIPVDNAISVQVAQPLTDLSDHLRDLPLRKAPNPLHQTVQLPLRCVLEYECDRSLAGEVAVEFDEVGVVECRLDGDPAFDLLCVVVLEELLATHYFEGDYEV
jgi:hypothetical protein